MNKKWKKIKEAVLGKDFELSLVFTDSKLMRRLNEKYRGKRKVTTVLSFPLSKKTGEIFLNLPLIKKEAKKLELDAEQYKIYLFIHSLLHLKGYRHGKEMNRKEQKILRNYYGQKNHHGN
ncbi:MAG: rRNA maturation RNase YbeY [Patescibacteria group bacterium]